MTDGVISIDEHRVRHERFDAMSVLRRRVSGTYRMDPWGLDVDAAHVAATVSALRWNINVEGIEQLPETGPALLIANRRLGWSEPLVAALGILRQADRVVRPAGGMDFDPIGGLARRFGAIPARVDEVAGALRASEMVLAPTRRDVKRFRAGHVPIELIAPAVELGVPVFPVAVVGFELGRTWSVRVGPQAKKSKKFGPRAVGKCGVEIAESLKVMLDDAKSNVRVDFARILDPIHQPIRAGAARMVEEF